MGIVDLKRRLEIGSFKERWPNLTDSIHESQEAVQWALSGPTIEELHRAEMKQIYANTQKQIQRIQEQTRLTIFDEKEN